MSPASVILAKHFQTQERKGGRKYHKKNKGSAQKHFLKGSLYDEGKKERKKKGGRGGGGKEEKTQKKKIDGGTLLSVRKQADTRYMKRKKNGGKRRAHVPCGPTSMAARGGGRLRRTNLRENNASVTFPLIGDILASFHTGYDINTIKTSP